MSFRLAYVNFDGSKAMKISKSIGKSTDLTIEELNHVCKDLWEGMNKLIEFLGVHES